MAGGAVGMVRPRECCWLYCASFVDCEVESPRELKQQTRKVRRGGPVGPGWSEEDAQDVRKRIVYTKYTLVE